MGGRRSLFRTAKTDLCPHCDERRTVLIFLGQPDRFFDQVDVIAVRNRHHLPAIRLEPQPDVLRKGDVGAAFNGNMIVVIEINQFAQSQCRRQRSRLGADALHQIAVGNQRIRIMIDD